MTSRAPAQCVSCRHLFEPGDTEDAERACAAFPGGIPDEIWWNRADHRKPFGGDGGVRWEPLDQDTVYPE